MLGARSNDSLYGKIVLRYVVFGILCVILVVSCAFLTTWSRTAATAAFWATPVGAIIPLAALWISGFELRRLLTAPEQIFTQLAELSQRPGKKTSPLIPVTDTEPMAAGWNQLLQQVHSGGVTKDLERKLSAALQTGQNGEFSHVLNSLTDGICVTSADGTVESANNAFNALMAVSDDQAGSRNNVFELLSRQNKSEDVPQEIAARVVKRMRFEMRTGDGQDESVLRVSCRSVEVDAEVADSFVWTMRDITQQKLAESMRTEFVQTATHELRTPLANIRAYAETLQLTDDIPVEQQKEFINVINAEATRLGRFVDELLNLSQMDAGSITISRHETHFERLLQECIENARPQIDRKQQSLETQIPAKLPSLNIDKDKIAACMVNLLGNASKYTPESGQIRLVVEEAATELTIRVEDTGYGISEEELPRVCSRFFRSDDSRVRDESGSGLGLAYTDEVARLHGGRLTVESELDKGSQFTLHLPL